MTELKFNNPFESKFPPVKNPSAQEVRASIKGYDGTDGNVYMSNEVTGKVHIKAPCKEMWMDVAELIDALQKIGVLS